MQEKTIEKRRRVLICTTAFLPLIGGSEIAIDEITRRLPEIYFDIVTGMLESGLPKFERSDNRRIHRVGGSLSKTGFILPKSFLPLVVFFKLVSLSRKNDYLAIHAFQASQAAGGAWLYRLLNGLPFIVTVQEGKDLTAQKFLTKAFRYLILGSAEFITVISNYLAGYAQAINHRAEILEIPNGVDTDIFKPAERAQLRQQLGWSATDRIIISVSRLVEKNGIADLIRAFSKLRHGQEAKLVLVGSGPLESDLRRLAHELGVIDSVRFIGSVPYEKVPQYLAASDIFVRPSRSEGLGTAFLEAMACGLPIVGTDVGGIPDFLEDGETGLF
ncbi:MAG TPA: glycosyltransferase, partial [Candidatus Paceibacterota bacterium]|nr:glycosyltransferase [Candidatus Paceibacterota bacterium]